MFTILQLLLPRLPIFSTKIKKINCNVAEKKCILKTIKKRRSQYILFPKNPHFEKLKSAYCCFYKKKVSAVYAELH